MDTQVTSNPVFQFESNKVRVVLIDNEPWFVAKDVCEVLGIQNSRETMSRLDSSEYVLIKKTDRRLNLRSINCDHIFNMDKKISGTSAVYLINESGLYSLVFRSRKPEALKFTKWVTSEVLPAIRKTGQYSAPQQEQSPPQEQKDPNRYIELTTDLDRNEFALMMELYTLLPARYRHATMEMVDIMAVTHAKSLTEFRSKLERNRLKVS